MNGVWHPEDLRCRDPQCPDFGDPDFGEGTCPASHADTEPFPVGPECEEAGG